MTQDNRVYKLRTVSGLWLYIQKLLSENFGLATVFVLLFTFVYSNFRSLSVDSEGTGTGSAGRRPTSSVGPLIRATGTVSLIVGKPGALEVDLFVGAGAEAGPAVSGGCNRSAEAALAADKDGRRPKKENDQARSDELSSSRGTLLGCCGSEKSDTAMIGGLGAAPIGDGTAAGLGDVWFDPVS